MKLLKLLNNFVFLKIFIFLLFFSFFFYNECFGAYPKLVNTIIAAFDQIKTWIIRIATPAAAVAVRFWGFYEEI